MSTTAAPARRRTQAERSAATQARLLDAALQCLVELGYAGTTTTVVAERAGVSRGAQLHHFPTRAALVAAAVEQRYAAVLELFTAARADRELRDHLRPIAERHQANVYRLAHRYFPEAARLGRAFDAVLTLVLDAMQGMASTRM